MKSLKSIANIRSKYIYSNANPLNFELPVFNTNSYQYYGSLSQSQKDSLVWVGGDNNVQSNQGPVFINSNTVWGFTTPFPDGNQCVGLQSNSYIQRPVLLKMGTRTISFFYHTRPNYPANPVSITLGTMTILGTLPNISANSWTPYSVQVNIVDDVIVLLRFVGTVTYDATTAINNIVIS